MAICEKCYQNRETRSILVDGQMVNICSNCQSYYQGRTAESASPQADPRKRCPFCKKQYPSYFAQKCVFCSDIKSEITMDQLIRIATKPETAQSGVHMLEQALKNSVSTITDDELKEISRLVVSQSTTQARESSRQDYGYMNDRDRDPEPEVEYETTYVPVDTRDLKQMAGDELNKRRLAGISVQPANPPNEEDVQKSLELERQKSELYERLVRHNEGLTRDFEKRCRELIKAGDNMEAAIRLKNKGLDVASIHELLKSWREGF